jgi:hypothetical protein
MVCQHLWLRIFFQRHILRSSLFATLWVALMLGFAAPSIYADNRRTETDA